MPVPAEGTPRVVPRSRVLTWLHHQWVRHPRWSMALKGAVAASLAWLVGLVAPPPFAEYPYYAPLGAVVAVSSTAVRSVKDSAQAVGAVLLGAVLARVVGALAVPVVVEIAVVVAVALLFAGWRLFGEMGTWVVTSALFVLVLGGAEKVEYTVAFAGLLVVGAGIGVAVNLVVPPLPLTPSELALDRLRDVLADEVDVLAGRLETEGPLRAQEWQERRREVAPTIARARESVAAAREAARANVRARRYGGWASAQDRRARELGTATAVVDEVVRLPTDGKHADRQEVAFGPRLRPVLARTLRAFGDGLRAESRDVDDAADGAAAATTGAAAAVRDAAARCEAAVEELAVAIRAERRTGDHDMFVAGALVVALWRGVAALGGLAAADARD